VGQLLQRDIDRIKDLLANQFVTLRVTATSILKLDHINLKRLPLDDDIVSVMQTVTPQDRFENVDLAV